MRIGLGLSIPELATRGGRFSPASLFTAGTIGAWYDPSDYSTLFQDSAGTTPVTAVEQPVGLMLDKSQGLVLGSNLVGSSISNASWENLPGTPASTVSGNQLTFGGQFSGRRWQVGSTVAGARYEFKFTARRISGNTALSFFHENSASGNQTAFTITDTAAEYSCRVLGNASGGLVSFGWQDRNASGQGTIEITNVSVREIPGNHASQATSTSRPVLRARYNLLTYSEQFDNGWWAKNAMTVTANQTVAPDGTTTADALIPTAVSAIHHTGSSLPISIVGVNTFSVYAKANGYQYVQLMWGSGTDYANFNLSGAGSVSQNSGGSPSIQSVGNGWYRCSITSTLASSSAVYILPVQTGTETRFASTTGDGTSGIFVWGADLRTGSSAGTYQRIAAATDYATAGFLPYLAFDGTDDSFGTGSINFSATDKMSVCAGVTKLSDAVQVIAELSANSDSTAGTFYLANVATSTLRHQVAGSPGGATRALGDTTLTNPSTAVVTQQFNIAGASVATQIVVRQNGVAQTLASTAGTAGTGNFSSNPLFIGRRNNASFPFNGRIYQMVVCGKTLSAAELASTEAYVATKTGVTL